MYPLALGPSQPPKPIPYGLVNLWDMMNFSLYSFMWALVLIRQEVAVAHSVADPRLSVSEEDLKRFRENLEGGIAPPLNAMFIAEGRLGTLFTMARFGTTYAELIHELAALDSDIMHSAEFERFYHYPRDKGRMVISVPGDWAATLRAFPSSEEDVRAAVDCYALGHNHASIHHSMMVLEFGLAAMAKRLKVPLRKDRSTWGPIIQRIRDQIEVRRKALAFPAKGSPAPSRRSSTAEKKFLDSCEEAAIEFRYFADVWRNHVSHGRAAYDENDAKKVLEHVRTFMEVVATKLKLKEVKIT